MKLIEILLIILTIQISNIFMFAFFMCIFNNKKMAIKNRHFYGKGIFNFCNNSFARRICFLRYSAM